MSGYIEEFFANGYWRRVFDNYAQWLPDYLHSNSVDCWGFGVYKFPMVPGFHVCRLGEHLGDDDDHAYVLSTHKTLHEAMGLCRVLLANGGVKYEGD